MKQRIRRLLKPVTVFALCAGLATACKSLPEETSSTSALNLTQFVDPYIGTGFHGHVFLGANVPFGAVQLGPTNISEGWDWCSGYHYSDSTIIGFAHTHLSGTGIGDLGDISVMPTTGAVKVTKGTAENPESGYVSLFSHEEEKARPGYYAVKLKRYDIDVELTATERVGFHQYTFPKTDEANIIIDLKEGIGWDLSTEAYITQLNDSTLAGYRYSKGWAEDQKIYFAAVFSKPIQHFSSYQITDSTGTTVPASKGNRLKGVVSFATAAGEKVKLKVGISPVSSENALANMKEEIPHWNFEQVVAQADAAWNRELQKAQIQTKDTAQLRTFYTALYHTMIAPSIFNDHNGDYRGTDNKLYKNAPFTNLTTFSLWDTYRAAHPLFTILQSDRVNDMINSMLAIYQQQGKLPVWHLMGNETNTMVGYSAVPVVVDAYLKGFTGFDADLAYEAIKTTAMQDDRGLKAVKKLGYIPADSEVENVAKGLEYAIDDWCIAQMAKKMGKQEDYEYFSKRARNYQNYFDPQTRFMRGRISQNEWRTPFDPFVSRHMKDDFTEGNAWQYTWLVPHDVEGLMQLLGGEAPFTQKLDSLFIVEGDMGEEASSDITGLIGQYAHGNEPSHHITYLYAYAGQPWKTADKVRYILSNLYSDKTDGLSGNEDVGQMSAWYIFSTLGFYPVNPANGAYVFGSPAVDQASLTLANGKVFRMKAINNSPENRYIQKISLDGRPYSKSYILHEDIMKGGELVFEMGSSPSYSWGVAQKDRPKSVLN
ncbi:putative alpha-1,2-mannosidase [Pontibacter ummariensis]|uniref:Alpha-1,2-mannosidase, putative n=1 Tax=Pontibacter ummariensis TaxID=1610492 RepID=A0A239G112_9BACT|nr:GH92 family glycosyl hydrolase [Pontibacter ummariensis]PRY11689.1 putative alpha-1,2-mannosidase [Pontibacter ummariensis]SNS62849.1 alpha-1,2-mannosidase, putative [Pontibacter ummariensis]